LTDIETLEDLIGLVKETVFRSKDKVNPQYTARNNIALAKLEALIGGFKTLVKAQAEQQEKDADGDDENECSDEVKLDRFSKTMLHNTCGWLECTSEALK